MIRAVWIELLRAFWPRIIVSKPRHGPHDAIPNLCDVSPQVVRPEFRLRLTHPRLRAFDVLNHHRDMAAGRHIPMVVENVKGAQPWVGKAQAKFGSYYLWGDIAQVGNRITRPMARFGDDYTRPERAEKFNPDGTNHPQGSWFKIADSKNRGSAVKNNGGSWFAQAHNTESGHSRNPVTGEEVKQPGHSGRAWFADPDVAGHLSSKSRARKAASAQIAKIPFELARWIAHCYHP